jgi:hypothetical protein
MSHMYRIVTRDKVERTYFYTSDKALTDDEIIDIAVENEGDTYLDGEDVLESYGCTIEEVY